MCDALRWFESGPSARCSFPISNSRITITRMNKTILLTLLLLCPSVVNAQQSRHPSSRSIDADRLARTVTIYRDTYGVPHVFGSTDASTVFGFAYAAGRG